MSHFADILILSNGPGELTTWVRPVVSALCQMLDNTPLSQARPMDIRISLILSPCPNASGNEVEIARCIAGIDRIQGASHFFPFLFLGKTAENWDWRDRGVVVFLGGDQIYPILIGKRLGYRTIIYGEWDTRWHRWGDRYAVMNASLMQKAPSQYAHKFTIVGDLMAAAAETMAKGKVEARSQRSEEPIQNSPTPLPAHPQRLGQRDANTSSHSSSFPTLGFLPGSKPAKLAQGVPLCLAIAHYLHQHNPHLRFVIPVAPTLDVKTLARFANVVTNPVLSKMGGISAELVPADGEAHPYPSLRIQQDLSIELHTEFPAYDLLRECQICVTTVGANTAELGSLGVPMLVLLPTQQLEAMKAWDGLPGLLANLPGVGDMFARFINAWFLRRKRLLAWPNIWAGEEIVPELVGNLQAEEIGDRILYYLNHPEKLEEMGDRLRQVRGEPGAATHLAHIILEELATHPPIR